MSHSDHGYIDDYMAQTIAATEAFATDKDSHAVLIEMASATVAALKAGKKLLIAGNGGSAADAQHIAGEFISRLMYDRAPIAAVALTTDSSGMTATGNDYGYEYIFERQVLALGQPGDLLLGISTSGRSPNVLRAFEAGRARGVINMGFCGARREPMAENTDILFCAPSTFTPIIQQIHITAAHLYCALVERAMFPRG